MAAGGPGCAVRPELPRGLHAFYRQQFEAADADGRGASLDRKQVADLPTLAALFLPGRPRRRRQAGPTRNLRRLPRSARASWGRSASPPWPSPTRVWDCSTCSTRTVTAGCHSANCTPPGTDCAPSTVMATTNWAATNFCRLRGPPDAGQGRHPPAATQKAKPGAETYRRRRGPAWFRKITPQWRRLRFPPRSGSGPEEFFHKLDADGDGLISPEEAECLASDERK